MLADCGEAKNALRLTTNHAHDGHGAGQENVEELHFGLTKLMQKN
jgi:hypothetical protein